MTMTLMMRLFLMKKIYLSIFCAFMFRPRKRLLLLSDVYPWPVQAVCHVHSVEFQ
jgi:hypothetical protein